MKITVVNACSDLGVHLNGSEKGPKKLEEVTKNIQSYTIEKENVEKELEKDNKRKNIVSLNNFNEKLFNIIVKENNFILTIGGDHSIAIPSALASKKKHGNIGIIWIDSHADFHNFETTISGNIHGMPFATLCGQNGKDLSYFFDGDYFKGENAVLVGGRDIEMPEYDVLKKAGVKIFTTDDIKQNGPIEIIKKAIDIASNNTSGIHISYDLDVIDPLIAPGVTIKAKNGINKEEAFNILNEILKNKNKIKSFDLVEFNPVNDVDDKTFFIAKEIIEKIIKEIDNDVF